MRVPEMDQDRATSCISRCGDGANLGIRDAGPRVSPPDTPRALRLSPKGNPSIGPRLPADPGALADRAAGGRAAGTGIDCRCPRSPSSSSRPRPRRSRTALWEAIRKLERLRPAFVSVTYGAGGSTQARTHATVRAHRQRGRRCDRPPISPASAPRAARWTRWPRNTGRPACATSWRSAATRPAARAAASSPIPTATANAVELVAGLRRVADFEISVSAYPEVHPEAASPRARPRQPPPQARRRRHPGDHPAVSSTTTCFLRFLDRCLAAGITAPIVPGILPLANLARSRPFIEKNGTTIPDWLNGTFAGLDDDEDMRRLVGAVVAAEQVRMLQANGVDEFHFYTMNPPGPDLRGGAYSGRPGALAPPASSAGIRASTKS